MDLITLEAKKKQVVRWTMEILAGRLPSSPRLFQTAHSRGGLIAETFAEKDFRYGWEGIWTEEKGKEYSYSLSGMIYAEKRMGRGGRNAKRGHPNAIEDT